jgi:chain length determinant protein tyrosine kinase EpsG
MQKNTVTQLNPTLSIHPTLESSAENNQPHLLSGKGQFGTELIALSKPYSPQVEALRALRGQLMMRWFNQEHKSLAIVSASTGEGCSYLAANLAVVFSQLGQRTLLVDANLRDPRQSSIFKLKINIGLADILAGNADLDAVTSLDYLDSLSVLGAGNVSASSHELLSRVAFKGFIKEAITNYDVVLIDTAPVSMTADAQATVAQSGGALMVSRLNHTRITDLTEMRDQIAITGAQIVGSVINDF